MHKTGSILKDVINRASLYTDQLFESGKYTEDDYMPVVHAAFEETLGRITYADQQRVVSRHDVQLVPNQRYYTLPPTVVRIIKVVKSNDDGSVRYEWDARGELHPQGPGWIMDGARTMRFDPIPKTDETLTVWFEAGASFGLHFSDAGGEIDSSTTLKLDTSLSADKDLGMYDRRTNAYVGARIRILPTGGVWEDHIVASQNGSTVTLRDPIETDVGTEIRYEAVPTYLQPIVEVVALTVALKMAVPLQLSRSKVQMLNQERAASIKTARELVSNMDERRGRFWETDTEYSREMAHGAYIPVVS